MATLPAPDTIHIAPEEAEEVRRPLAEASFLPPRVYADRSLFEAERDRVFRRSWLPVCHISQLAVPGTYFARELFGEPIVATRDKAGAIRVLSNVCRHRNAVLSKGDGPCKGSRLTCPYHGWAYGLDGKLLAAPFMSDTEGFARADIRLPELRHEIWQGFLFVNFDADADPLAPQLATLTPRVEPYRLDQMVAVEVRRARAPWNWKISLENFSEAYHQPFIHPITADRDFPAATAVYEDSDGPWSLFWIPTRDGSVAPTIAPPVPGMPDSYYRAFSVINVYPLLHMFVDAATPLWMDWSISDVNEHEMIWYMLVPQDQLRDDNRDQLIHDFLHFIEPILIEDVDVCQAVGRGVHSALARPGRLSYMEKAVHQFQRWWLDRFEA
jgi:choline monooxygenase